MSAEQAIKDMVKEAVSAQHADLLEEMRAKAKEMIADTAKQVTNTQIQALKAAGASLGAAKASVEMDDEGNVEHFQSGKGSRFLFYILRAAEAGYRGMAGRDYASQLASKDGNKITAKALSSSILGDGGALVPGEFASEIIEALVPISVVQGAGATVVPMNNGSLSLPFIDTSAAASYVAENKAAAVSQPGTGLIQLRDHKLRCIVPVSNDLLRNGGANAENAVRRNMMRVLGARRDLAFLRGDSVNGTPKGIKEFAQNSQDATLAPTVATITTDTTSLLAKVWAQNVTFTNPVWFMSSRSFWFLRGLRTTNGEYAFPELQMAASGNAMGMLLGFPVYVSNQIPENLDYSGMATNDESEIYFVNAEDMIIAQNEEMRVEAFPGGSYNDGTNQVSGIQTDQVVLALTDVHDFGMNYRGREAGVINQVRYGA